MNWKAFGTIVVSAILVTTFVGVWADEAPKSAQEPLSKDYRPHDFGSKFRLSAAYLFRPEIARDASVGWLYPAKLGISVGWDELTAEGIRLYFKPPKKETATVLSAKFSSFILNKYGSLAELEKMTEPQGVEVGVIVAMPKFKEKTSDRVVVNWPGSKGKEPEAEKLWWAQADDKDVQVLIDSLIKTGVAP